MVNIHFVSKRSLGIGCGVALALQIGAFAGPLFAETEPYQLQDTKESSSEDKTEYRLSKDLSLKSKPLASRAERFGGSAFKPTEGYNREKILPLESDEDEGKDESAIKGESVDSAKAPMAPQMLRYPYPETATKIDSQYSIDADVVQQIYNLDVRDVKIAQPISGCGGSYFTGIGYLPSTHTEPPLRAPDCNNAAGMTPEECSDRYFYSVATDITLTSNYCPAVSAYQRIFKGCEPGITNCSPAPNPARMNRVRGFKWTRGTTNLPVWTRISPCRSASSGNGTAELFPPGTNLNCSSYPTTNSPSTTNTYRSLGAWPMSIAPGGNAVVGLEAYFVAGNNFIRQQGFLWNAASNSFAMLGDMESASYPNERNNHCTFASGALSLTSTANPLKVAGFGSINPDGFVDTAHLNAANHCDAWGIESSVTPSLITAGTRLISNPSPLSPFSEAVSITADGGRALVNQYINEGGPITPELQSLRSVVVNTSTLAQTVLVSPTGAGDSQVQGEVIVGSSSAPLIGGQALLGSVAGQPPATAYATEAVIWNGNGTVNTRLGRRALDIALHDCTSGSSYCPSTELRDLTPSRVAVGIQFYKKENSAWGGVSQCEYPNFNNGGVSRFTYRADEARQAIIAVNTPGQPQKFQGLYGYLKYQYHIRGNETAKRELANWSLCEATGVYENTALGILTISGTGVRDGKVQGFVAYIAPNPPLIYPSPTDVAGPYVTDITSADTINPVLTAVATPRR